MEKKTISDFIPAHFHDLMRAANTKSILNIVAKGGRGSGKSTDVAIIFVYMTMKYAVNGVVVRKTDNTLATSVFEQIKEAINMLGVEHLFKTKISPMEITFLPRGNKIIFRGAQNPERLKSLKDAKFPYAIAWIEELAEFKTEDEVTTITNSILRAELKNGLHYKFFFTYNPPKRKQSWVNKKYESVSQPKHTYVHHSTYLNNPYIAKQFVEEAEATKKRNEIRYRWEYLGEAIGSGVVPFNNLVFKTISQSMIDGFDNIRNGLDFGYSNDPMAFVRWHYDKKKRTIYAIDEYYGVQISNRKLADWIKSKDYQSDIIYADHAEPKSIDELKKEHGIKKVLPVKKGADSREYGERWLDDLDAIVIDPNRTPNIAREFELADYKTDKDGNTIPKLEDKDDHTIDATRYGFERDMKQNSIRFLQ
ncbi:PBSX family phage terminase large subunit (plasmid) [Staphylococcus aureus]|uniref:PBSX family phage terminase large subunit n=1 Tax=Staphylococcus aureus TaxID=1280 RepID=UPI0021CE1CF4|nr:PBSX family phage terminase large subunit [Staphylococcus aureus]UXV54403.1 PBSX family phage terminase large subunit [Staphylococcus aureus]UXV57115.1 PBSX family phage terminase large subunit [Staphylococcus aureus]